NADDPVVRGEAARAPSTVQLFSMSDAATGTLVVNGEPVVAVSDLQRAWPHDVSNALAAAMTAMSAGASASDCADVLRAFRGLPHRVELIGDAGGVEFYDDSKATPPASVVTAVAGFDSVVLIA